MHVKHENTLTHLTSHSDSDVGVIQDGLIPPGGLLRATTTTPNGGLAPDDQHQPTCPQCVAADGLTLQVEGRLCLAHRLGYRPPTPPTTSQAVETVLQTGRVLPPPKPEESKIVANAEMWREPAGCLLTPTPSPHHEGLTDDELLWCHETTIVDHTVQTGLNTPDAIILDNGAPPSADTVQVQDDSDIEELDFEKTTKRKGGGHIPYDERSKRRRLNLE